MRLRRHIEPTTCDEGGTSLSTELHFIACEEHCNLYINRDLHFRVTLPPHTGIASRSKLSFQLVVMWGAGHDHLPNVIQGIVYEDGLMKMAA